ncbi:unnamed protein product [Rotaria sp. Silwood2]|nr:unnamed protein product [Rotaria sp. Silwood2]
MKEKALSTIRNSKDKNNLELIDTAQMRFERTLQLKYQLNKLNRRLNENMPPPALNVMHRLQFKSKELNKEIIDQYSEQWNNTVTGQIVAGKIVADKSSRTNRCGQYVAWTNRCRTKCRGHFVADKTSWTIRRTDISSHGQNVAWANRRKDE